MTGNESGKEKEKERRDNFPLLLLPSGRSGGVIPGFRKFQKQTAGEVRGRRKHIRATPLACMHRLLIVNANAHSPISIFAQMYSAGT